MSRLVPDGLDVFPASLLEEAAAGFAAEGRVVFTFGEPISGVTSDGRKVDCKKVLDGLQTLETTDQAWISLGDPNDRGSGKEVSQEFWDALRGMTLGGVGPMGAGDHREVRDVTISDIRCGELDLKVRNVVFRNLTVARMRLWGNGLGSIRFENCIIGRLEFPTSSAVDLSFRDGSILCLTLPGEVGARSIDISGTKLSKRPVRRRRECNDCPSWIFLDAVTFRSLHRWAQEKEDAKLAHQMRGHQLSVDYYLAGKAERPFLWLWWFFGNYGLSLWRPLLWLMVCVIGFAGLLYCSGTVAADAALPIREGGSAQDALGWRAVLIGEEHLPRLSRALVGSVEAVFSPLNVFSIRKLVLPEQWWVAVFQFLYSYLCLGLIFLFGFSIRRRFKI